MKISDILPPSAFRFSRKACDLAEALSSLDDPAYVNPARIDWAHELTPAAYDEFACGLLMDVEWLGGLDGLDGNEPGIIRCVLVTAPDRPPLLVDSQGYSYARFIGLLVEHADAYRETVSRLRSSGLL